MYYFEINRRFEEKFCLSIALETEPRVLTLNPENDPEKIPVATSLSHEVRNKIGGSDGISEVAAQDEGRKSDSLRSREDL